MMRPRQALVHVGWPPFEVAMANGVGGLRVTSISQGERDTLLNMETAKGSWPLSQNRSLPP